MAWVVLTVIFALVLGGCIIAGLGSEDPDAKLFAGGSAAVATVLWVGLTIGLSITKIGTGEIGLQYSFSGKLLGQKDSPGIVWKSPWSSIKKVDVLLQREEFDLGNGNSAVSKDQQPIFAHLVLNYEVDPKHVIELYKTVGPNWKAKLIDSRVLQDFKEITSTYPTVEITSQREQLRVDTRHRLEQELSPYSITVRDLFVQNLAFSDAYTRAIEQKQVQVQAAARAQAKVAQVKAEADQRAAEAEGEARATLAKAEAQAKANRLLSNSVSDRLIELKRVEALASANTIYVPANWTAFGNLTGK